jgi:hypothetical protein
VSLLAVEPELHNGAFATKAMFQTEEFRARFDAAISELRKPRGSPPGLFNAGQRALDAFRKMTSDECPGDPLLRLFRAKYLDAWNPHLGPADSVRICVSTWDTVAERTRAAFGHCAHDSHFYVVVVWHLPEETADQLLQLARLNPDRQTWAQLAARNEFRRAEEISRAARESIARRFLAYVALEPKRSEPAFVHTTTDVLVPDVRCDRLSHPSVAYYSDCACSSASAGGVVSMSESDPDATHFWWHGPHTPEHAGGEAFEMPGSAHAMPVFGTKLAWKRATLALLADAGHKVEHGYAKLSPIL